MPEEKKQKKEEEQTQDLISPSLPSEVTPEVSPEVVQEKKEEIVITEEITRMVTVNRFEGIPRASLSTFINTLEDCYAFIEEVHSQVLKSVVKRHSDNSGSTVTDIRQVRAVLNKYAEAIRLGSPALMAYYERWLKQVPAIILHMENERKRWNESNKLAGNVKFVEVLSK